MEGCDSAARHYGILTGKAWLAQHPRCRVASASAEQSHLHLHRSFEHCVYLDSLHAPVSLMKASPPALLAHVSTTDAASGAQEFRMPLGMNGLLPTQLFIGTVPWRGRVQWDMQGVFCLPVVWIVYLSCRQTCVACSACCCIEAATPAPHEPAAQSATSAGTRPIIPTDSSPAPPPKSDIPAWLQEAKDSAGVNSCVPSEIVQKRCWKILLVPI